MRRLLVITSVVPSSPILVTLMKEALEEAHGVTSQKIPFFIVTAVKTSNLTFCSLVCFECISGHLGASRFQPFSLSCDVASLSFPSLGISVIWTLAAGRGAACLVLMIS
jgi:hypothetical protein